MILSRRFRLATLLLPLFCSQAFAGQRSVDKGSPFPPGCLDDGGYVRIDDVVGNPAAIGSIGALLRSNKIDEAKSAIRNLRTASIDEAIAKRKLALDVAKLQSKLEDVAPILAREINGIVSRKGKVPLDLLVARAYVEVMLFGNGHGLSEYGATALKEAVVALKSQPSSSLLQRVVLATIEANRDLNAARMTLQKAVEANPKAYTTRMLLVWYLAHVGTGSEEPLRLGLYKKAFAHAKVLAEQEPSYVSGVLEAGSMAELLGEPKKAVKYYRRYLKIASPSHAAYRAIQEYVKKHSS